MSYELWGIDMLHYLMMGIQYPEVTNIVTEHHWRIDSIVTPVMVK